MSNRFTFLAAAGLAAVAVGAHAQGAAGSGGTATYWMSAETASGMSAMGQGSSQMRNLTLQLGTGRRAPGEPSAEHLPPPSLKAGTSLPLVSPPRAQSAAPPSPYSYAGAKPKGRMLSYWGCGEHARPGQPVVVDFASLSAGKVPPAFAAAALKFMTPPSAANNATYGEWPNTKSKAHVPASGSLVGEHIVRGNYTPEIKFALAPGQDFLAPVALTTQSAAASGAVPLMWKPIAQARGWSLSTAGAAANGDMVMWTSSEKQAAAMMTDYLAPEEVARLVAQKVLLPGSADRCTVPQEVAKAAPQSMLSMTAFGPEANFSYPARPARAGASWRPEWAAKLRTKSTYMGILGTDMAAMMSGRDADDAEEEAPRRPRSKAEKIGRGLGRLLGN
jgi:hypothetical protein